MLAPNLMSVPQLRLSLSGFPEGTAEAPSRPSSRKNPDEGAFAAVVLHEGEEITRMVSDLMGDHVLMFGSDYPHAESRFPRSADIALGWDSLGEERLRKLMWENAARCFRL